MSFYCLKCKEDILQSMHTIYDKIKSDLENIKEKETNNNSASVSVITKNKDNKITAYL